MKDKAKLKKEVNHGDFISLFIKYYHQVAPGHSWLKFLPHRIAGQGFLLKFDSEVEKVLRESVQSAIDNSFNCPHPYPIKFGVVQPNIQKLEGQGGRIMVEMPGVREPERYA